MDKATLSCCLQCLLEQLHISIVNSTSICIKKLSNKTFDFIITFSIYNKKSVENIKIIVLAVFNFNEKQKY